MYMVHESWPYPEIRGEDVPLPEAIRVYTKRGDHLGILELYGDGENPDVEVMEKLVDLRYQQHH